MQEDREMIFAHMDLSDAWLELLGQQNIGATCVPNTSIIPALESDPWSSLLHTHGVEIVDLQKVHLPMSDADVEQILQCMQDQSAQYPEL